MREGKGVFHKSTALLCPLPLSNSLPEVQPCQLRTCYTINTPFQILHLVGSPNTHLGQCSPHPAKSGKPLFLPHKERAPSISFPSHSPFLAFHSPSCKCSSPFLLIPVSSPHLWDLTHALCSHRTLTSVSTPSSPLQAPASSWEPHSPCQGHNQHLLGLPKGANTLIRFSLPLTWPLSPGLTQTALFWRS